MLQLPLQSSDVSAALWEPLPAEGETEMVARPGHSPKEMIGADSACDCMSAACRLRLRGSTEESRVQSSHRD